MDIEWALGKLKAYRSRLAEYRTQTGYIRSPDTKAKLAKLESQLDQDFTLIQSIIDEVRPGLGKSAMMTSGVATVRGTQAAIIAVDLAIGEYSTRDERAAMMGTPAPKLSADTLHPWVWQAASSLWGTGHRREAVQAAATLLNANVQTKVGRRDVSDSGLMNQCFSTDEPAEGKPRLRWPGDQTDIRVVSMNNGLRGYAAGVFQTIRNSASHDPADIPEQDALEQLATLSLLARWVEKCTVATAKAEVSHAPSRS